MKSIEYYNQLSRGYEGLYGAQGGGKPPSSRDTPPPHQRVIKSVEYYDQLSRGYEELYGAEQRAKFSYLSDWLEIIPQPVLDVGAGTGLLSEFLEVSVMSDSSLGMLSKASGSRVVCDARFLPFKDKSFKSITCFTVLQDIIDKKSVLRELQRVASERVILTILKRLIPREQIESLLDGFKILEYREEERDNCFLLEPLKG